LGELENISFGHGVSLLRWRSGKSRNPNSVVKLKDMESGAEIVIAFKAAQQ
jgi:hypothetical protein